LEPLSRGILLVAPKVLVLYHPNLLSFHRNVLAWQCTTYGRRSPDLHSIHMQRHQFVSQDEARRCGLHGQHVDNGYVPRANSLGKRPSTQCSRLSMAAIPSFASTAPSSSWPSHTRGSRPSMLSNYGSYLDLTLTIATDDDEEESLDKYEDDLIDDLTRTMNLHSPPVLDDRLSSTSVGTTEIFEDADVLHPLLSSPRLGIANFRRRLHK
jgi:hypothetical protein